MRRVVGPTIGVKAAGGIRDLDSALALIQDVQLHIHNLSHSPGVITTKRIICRTARLFRVVT